jgi:hypothetical protein
MGNTTSVPRRFQAAGPNASHLFALVAIARVVPVRVGTGACADPVAEVLAAHPPAASAAAAQSSEATHRPVTRRRDILARPRANRRTVTTWKRVPPPSAAEAGNVRLDSRISIIAAISAAYAGGLRGRGG